MMSKSQVFDCANFFVLEIEQFDFGLKIFSFFKWSKILILSENKITVIFAFRNRKCQKQN